MPDFVFCIAAKVISRHTSAIFLHYSITLNTSIQNHLAVIITQYAAVTSAAQSAHFNGINTLRSEFISQIFNLNPISFRGFPKIMLIL